MLDEISSKEKVAILIRTLEEGVAKVIEYMTAEEKKYYFVKSQSFVYTNQKR